MKGNRSMGERRALWRKAAKRVNLSPEMLSNPDLRPLIARLKLALGETPDLEALRSLLDHREKSPESQA